MNPPLHSPSHNQKDGTSILPLQSWIDKSRPATDVNLNLGASTPKESLKYVKLALPVALKLTECLIEAEIAEINGRMNPIPLVSITSKNITVEVREIDPLIEPFEVSDDLPLVSEDTDIGGLAWDELVEGFASSPDVDNKGQEPEQNHDFEVDTETIDRVQITPSNGDKVDVGSKSARLLALGIVLFQLFSGENPEHDLLQFIDGFSSCSALPGNSFTRTDSPEANGSDCRPDSRAKLQRRLSFSGNDLISQYLGKLEMSNIPQSLRTIVTNLFDCANNGPGAQDAYKSFEELHLDLKLLLNDPSHFLEDIQVELMPSFSMRTSLYGREQQAALLEQYFDQGMKGQCEGVIISGPSGIGKSQLAMRVQELTQNASGYFLTGKFDQNQDLLPLTVIRSAFNQFCKHVIQDTTIEQQEVIMRKLNSALGSQLVTLKELLPDIQPLLPCLQSEYSSSANYGNAEKKIQYLFFALLQTLSSHFNKKVTLFFDDIQWADASSLSLLWSLVVNSKNKNGIFFVACFRDEELESNVAICKWLKLFLEAGIILPSIQLCDLEVDAINHMVSDALRLTPRLTLPLSKVLHHKTRGNPFFLKRLLESLREEGLIHFSLIPRRWMWELDDISKKDIPDGVIDLLTRRFCTLPEDVQNVLKLASCIGGSIDKSLLGILSDEVGLNLDNVLSQAVQMGFMSDAGTQYSFVHDKIQQASYQLIPTQERPLYHLRYGLAICAHAINRGQDDNTLFVAVNQINSGCSSVQADTGQKNMIASLNLKAGKRSMELSDFSSASKFFEHGMYFLDDDHWESQYELSVKLINAAVEVACVLGNLESVQSLSSKLLSNAKSYEDRSTTYYFLVKCLREAALYQEAKHHAIEVLEQLGEDVHSILGDSQLNLRIQETKTMLANVDENVILSMADVNEKKVITTMNMYKELMYTLQFVQPSKMGAVSLRSVQLTLTHGLCSVSPLAFANFGYFLVSFGDPNLGYRLGKLAMNMKEKLNTIEHTSTLIGMVCGLISWTKEPIQAMSDIFLYGFKTGQQLGDISASSLNYQQFLIGSFVGGEKLLTVKQNSTFFINKMMLEDNKSWVYHALPLYFQTIALTGDKKVEETQRTNNENYPTEKDIVARAVGKKNIDLTFVVSTHQMIRAFLLRDYKAIAAKAELFSKIAHGRKVVRIIFVIGRFYEGLVSFSMARQTEDNKWRLRGETALTILKYWSQFSLWNFENKALLLEAEKMYFEGNDNLASRLYDGAIKSAHNHKFIHEEGVACELAGSFHYDKANYSESFEMFTRARDCYSKWGATVLVSRIDNIFKNNFDPKFLAPTTKERSLSSTLNNVKRHRKIET